MRALLLSILLVAAVASAFLLPSCSSPIPNRNPVGELFPSVQGESLDSEVVKFPQVAAGEPAVLLIGYLQEAQFDADRWLYGLLSSKVSARIFEVPTLSGLFPRMIANTIDEGMRGGIPQEDWQVVVTLYGDDADAIRNLTGNEQGSNMRVVLLDRDGKIVWFHDRGFSAAKLIELEKAAATL